MNLINDVLSHIKKGVVYGKANDVVIVVSDFGNVVIVEGINGNRFPCKSDNITTQIIPSEKPLTITKPIPHKVEAKTRAKPAPLNNQLF